MDKIIRVAKWNTEVNYEVLKYPRIEYVNGIDMGDVSKSAFILFSIDPAPQAAITLNMWHQSTDQGIVQNSVEWELPDWNQDKDSEIIHYLLLHVAGNVYPNGFELMTDKEMLDRLAGLVVIVDLSINPKLREAVKNAQG